jgi:hypothetical protein
MNRSLFQILLGLTLLGGMGKTVLSADTKVANTNSAAASTNAAPVVNTNDFRSIFEEKGRDPFYPNSSRQAIQASADNNGDAPAVVLVLKGISGTANHRLAIINDRTFASGDEDVVVTAAGRVKIRCLEIHNDMAVVTIGNSPEKIDLRLPSHF